MKKTPIWPGLMVVVSVMALLIALISFGRQWAQRAVSDWKGDEVAVVSDAMGRQFVFLRRFSLQGRDIGLAEKNKAGQLRVIHMIDAEWHDGPAPFIRTASPSSGKVGEGELYMCPDGSILGAYQAQFLYRPGTTQFLRTAEMYALSPFTCIGPADRLNAEDVGAWEQAIHQADKVALWKKESIQRGLSHPNPEVRLLAKKWLQPMNPLGSRSQSEK